MRILKIMGMALMIFPLGALVQAKSLVEAGPHGGRLMTAGKYKVEFHLDKDRKARVYLFDAALKPLATDLAVITLKASKGGTRTLDLVKANADPKKPGSLSHLAGKSAMPSPDGYLVSLSVKISGQPANVFRFNFLEEICGGCKLQEYACTCGH